LDIVLNQDEARVLGSLIEKEITTPDYYPMSLNALVNACNQKSNREPLMNLDENAVREALRGLRDLDLTTSRVDSRVPKYEHRIQEVFNFTRGETAIVCALLLRGPQTVGELRGRSERLYTFDDLEAVESTLARLAEMEFAKKLPRLPGSREARWAHLLSGDVEAGEEPVETHGSAAHAAEPGPSDRERIAALEQEVAELRRMVEELKRAFE
jgi:uncharacterized protein